MIPLSNNCRQFPIYDDYFVLDSVVYSGSTTGAVALASTDIMAFPTGKTFTHMIIGNLSAVGMVACRWHFNNSGNNYSEIMLHSGIPIKIDPYSIYAISGTAKSGLLTYNPTHIILLRAEHVPPNEIVGPLVNN